MEFAYLPEIFRPSRAVLAKFESRSRAQDIESKYCVNIPGALISNARDIVGLSIASRLPKCSRILSSASEPGAVLQSLLAEVGKSSIKEILSTHKLVTGAAKSRFRKGAVVVGMTTSQPMAFMAAEYEIKPEMDWLLGACDSIESESSMFAFFLFFFLHVHPFSDGNGRMSRLGLLGISRRRGEGAINKALILLSYIERHKLDFVRAMYVARISSPDYLLLFVEQAFFTSFERSA